MPVTTADAIAHLRRVEARREDGGRRRAARAGERLPEAARVLRGRYGVREVILFGSLAGGTPHAGSDVDLAVEGLPSREYFAALADLMDIFGGGVDLVRLEDAPESLRDRVAAEGRRL